GGAGAAVDVHAAVGVRDPRVDAHAQSAAGQALGLLRIRQALCDLRPGESVGVELVPGAPARLGRDRLGEIVLGPRRLSGKELLAAVVHAAGEAAVELGGGDELLLGDRARHRASVELVARGSLRAAAECEVDAVAV